MTIWGGHYYDYDLETNIFPNTGGRYCASAGTDGKAQN
jgi:hypothetical protein